MRTPTETRRPKRVGNRVKTRRPSDPRLAGRRWRRLTRVRHRIPNIRARTAFHNHRRLHITAPATVPRIARKRLPIRTIVGTGLINHTVFNSVRRADRPGIAESKRRTRPIILRNTRRRLGLVKTLVNSARIFRNGANDKKEQQETANAHHGRTHQKNANATNIPPKNAPQ